MSISFLDIYHEVLTADWLKQPFTGFTLDSRTIQPKQIYIALTSLSQPEKTRFFAEQALKAGALGIISEKELGLAQEWVYPDVRMHLGQWQRDYLQVTDPVLPMRVVAVTGTNGKTTISRLCAELIHLQKQHCAVFGTTGNGILPDLKPSTHTTLDALQLQQALHQYAKQDVVYAALEASSHGLVQGRLNGCPIEVAIYSNLSRDHLDYHGSIQAYAEAKAELFAFETLKYAVINLDADYAQLMLDTAQQNPSQPQIITYSLKQDQANYIAKSIDYSLGGVKIELKTPKGDFTIHSPFLGQFNVENLLASLIAVEALGFDLPQLIETVPHLLGAPGRMQVIRDAERIFIVDYAHTPDALTQVLQTLKRHTRNRLWAVFGCGGDRDRGKRPLMVQAALDQANLVVLTSDNPRTEEQTQIFNDMRQGIDLSLHDVFEIADRRQAIKFVVNEAKNGDIVLIAGKGHEDYQDIDGVRHWFDDVVEVRAALDTPTGLTSSAYSAQS